MLRLQKSGDQLEMFFFFDLFFSLDKAGPKIQNVSSKGKELGEGSVERKESAQKEKGTNHRTLSTTSYTSTPKVYYFVIKKNRTTYASKG